MGLKQKQDYVNWLREYNWAWFCTLTFRDGIWRKAAIRLFGKWIAQLQAVEPDIISWVRMAEYSPENRRYHFHILLAGLQPSNMRTAIALWERLAGRAEIGLYDSNRRGLEYLLKSLEETSAPDFDAQLREQHRRISSRGGSMQALPAALVTAKGLRSRPASDATPPHGTGVASVKLTPAEHNSSVGQEEMNEQTVLRAQSRAATRPCRRTFRPMTMRELWTNLRQKCRSPKPPNHKSHDKRPVICCRWKGRNGFKLFVQDMGQRPSPQHRLRRIDSNAAFSPFNCAWEISSR